MKTYRILVVDPDESQRSRIRSVLERVAKELDAAVDVSEAHDGTTAMAMCADKTFSLVLAEAVLPGVSGLALLRSLAKRDDPRPPVILVTSMGRETDRYWGLRNGALAYFAKPFDETALADRVQRTLIDPKPKSDRPIQL